MAEKITYEQFIQSVTADNHKFTEDLHNYLIEAGCKVTFEEKKSGYLASYKFGKPLRAVMNFLFRKEGMLVRIYGEWISNYPEFLETLPAEMIQHLEGAGDCKRMTNNTCSTKCMGYDFTIADMRFQKCRYNCFEFLITNISKPVIKEFIALELSARKKRAS